MKLTAIVAATVASLLNYSTPAAANPMDIYNSLNVACRGGSGDSIETQKACKARNEYAKQLPKLGYCWRDGQSNADSYWQRGRAKRDGSCRK